MYTIDEIKNASRDCEFEFTCQQCGKKIIKTKQMLSKNRYQIPKFCCPECQQKWIKDNSHITVHCENCGKEIKILKSVYKKSSTKHFFCSHSCSATYNNTKRKRKTDAEWRGVRHNQGYNKCPICGNDKQYTSITCKECAGLIKRNYIKEYEQENNVIKNKNHKLCDYDNCPICGNKKHRTATICKNCANAIKRSRIKERTLGSYVNGYKYLGTRCGEIRRDARRTLEESTRDKCCEYCHDASFNDILQVHHIRGILEFDRSATVGEINNEKNLVWLCPNHHKMLELGLIKLDENIHDDSIKQ